LFLECVFSAWGLWHLSNPGLLVFSVMEDVSLARSHHTVLSLYLESTFVITITVGGTYV